MIIKRISPDKELLERTAPEGIRAVVLSEKYDIYMSGLFDEGKLLSYAVFSHIPGKNREVFLEYLFTMPSFRDKGMCTLLLEECEKRLKAMGTDVILIKQVIGYEEAEELHSFLKNRSYHPLNMRCRMLLYRLSEMLDAGAIQTILKNRKKLPMVTDYEGAGEKHINALLARQKETGFYFYKEECDERYSRFYMHENRISAALIASLVDGQMLSVTGIYMDETAGKQGMFLPLFSECIYSVCKDRKDTDLSVSFFVDNDNIYNGLMKVFNPPETELLVLEYMKAL